MLFGAMLLLIALAKFRQGAVVQLGKFVEYERLHLAAQAGLAELTVLVRDSVNVPGTEVSAVVEKAFADPQLISAHNGDVSWSGMLLFPASTLREANRIAAITVGRAVSVTGEVRLTLTEKVGLNTPSYIGNMEFLTRIRGTGVSTLVSREIREVRLTDLRDLFLDKYVLYVKNTCVNLNHPGRRLIVEGISKDNVFSRVYLGNRFYPPCSEFPQGEKGGKNPPIFLDLDFLGDRPLVQNFCTPQTEFSSRESKVGEASRGNFFHVRQPFIPFGKLRSRFALPEFYFVSQIRDFYRLVIDSCRPYGNVENSVSYEVMKDNQAAGGKPEKSKLFQAIVDTCAKGWDYHYGYTDYSHLVGPDVKPTQMADVSHFMGVYSYFSEYKDLNPQRLLGGKMPLLFGEARDKPLVVEGPAYLRFFKVAFFDHFVENLPMLSEPLKVNIQEVPLAFQHPSRSPDFAGKKIGPIDEIGLETVLMSRAVESLPINNLWFGDGKPRLAPRPLTDPRAGDDIYPEFEDSLKTVSHLYDNSQDFRKHQIYPSETGDRLHLDGISVILGLDGAALDLTKVHSYQGKGMILLLRGNCFLGTLRRATGPASDFLRIYTVNGGFSVKGAENPTEIEAALVATTFHPAKREMSYGFDANHHSVIIKGQLVVDDLLELLAVDKDRSMKIIHDDALFLPEKLPRRVSISPIRTNVSHTLEEN